MNLAELTEVVGDLAARIAALEAGPSVEPARADADTSIVRSMIDEIEAAGDGSTDGGTVLYAGAVPSAGRLAAWQMNRTADDLLAADPATTARLLAALGSPQRVQIVQLLIASPATTSELTARLDEPSAGQLFHHLKELLAAGVIHQPRRGVYAVHPQHVVPLLTVISCSVDLTAGSTATA
jgi:DNA-binding transcriptional ArsR family regulator